MERDQAFGKFLEALKRGAEPTSPPGEFSLSQFAKYCRNVLQIDIGDLDARELLRQAESSGQIKYTEIMFWRVKGL